VTTIQPSSEATPTEILRESSGGDCPICGDGPRSEQFLLTTEWVEELYDRLDEAPPDGTLTVRLCPDCSRRAERIEQGEIGLRFRPPEERERIRKERGDFLQLLLAEMASSG